MKLTIVKKVTSIILASTLSFSLLAADYDYSTQTNEQLNTLRGTLRDASPEQQNAFRTEWQVRKAAMNSEDRAKYSGRPANAKMDGTGKQMRNRNGSGGQGQGRRGGK